MKKEQMRYHELKHEMFRRHSPSNILGMCKGQLSRSAPVKPTKFEGCIPCLVTVVPSGVMVETGVTDHDFVHWHYITNISGNSIRWWALTAYSQRYNVEIEFDRSNLDILHLIEENYHRNQDREKQEKVDRLKDELAKLEG